MPDRNGRPKMGRTTPDHLTTTTIRDAIGSAVMHRDSPIPVVGVEPLDGDIIVLTLENGQRFAICVGED